MEHVTWTDDRLNAIIKNFRDHKENIKDLLFQFIIDALEIEMNFADAKGDAASVLLWSQALSIIEAKVKTEIGKRL